MSLQAKPNADPELRKIADIIDKLAKNASDLPIFVPILLLAAAGNDSNELAAQVPFPLPMPVEALVPLLSSNCRGIERRYG